MGEATSPTPPAPSSGAAPLPDTGGPIPSAAAVEAEYQERLSWCDRVAARYKIWFRLAWAAAVAASWLTLLSAIAAMTLEAQDPTKWAWLEKTVLHVIRPAGTLVVIGATTYQLLRRPRSRWRNARRSAEELRSECMRYRLGLPPYDGADAAAIFCAHVRTLGSRANSTEGRHFLARRGPHPRRPPLVELSRLVSLPPELASALPHTPDDPAATDRGGSFEQREAAVRVGRLLSQQRWHLLKARRYFRWFVTLQTAVIAVNLLALLLHVPPLHVLPLYVVALATGVSLMLYAVRDGLDLGPLCQRYLWVAEMLEEVREDYLAGAGEYAGKDPEERLRLLGQHTEQVLAGECQFWYASVG